MITGLTLPSVLLETFILEFPKRKRCLYFVTIKSIFGRNVDNTELGGFEHILSPFFTQKLFFFP